MSFSVIDLEVEREKASHHKMYRVGKYLSLLGLGLFVLGWWAPHNTILYGGAVIGASGVALILVGVAGYLAWDEPL